MPANVTIYTRRGCGYCTRLLALLDRKGVVYTHHDLSNEPARRQWLTEVTGSSTVPQMFIGETAVGGCTDVEALDRAGKLDPMLAG